MRHAGIAHPRVKLHVDGNSMCEKLVCKYPTFVFPRLHHLSKRLCDAPVRSATPGEDRDLPRRRVRAQRPRLHPIELRVPEEKLSDVRRRIYNRRAIRWSARCTNPDDSTEARRQRGSRVNGDAYEVILLYPERRASTRFADCSIRVSRSEPSPRKREAAFRKLRPASPDALS